MINAAALGEIKGLYFMGENPAMSDPDAGHVRKARCRLDHLVVQDIFLTETAALADVVLPTTSMFEKWGLVHQYEPTGTAFATGIAGPRRCATGPLGAPGDGASPRLEMVLRPSVRGLGRGPFALACGARSTGGTGSNATAGANIPAFLRRAKARTCCLESAATRTMVWRSSCPSSQSVQQRRRT